MKKYNLSNIMKKAWQIVKTSGATMSAALKNAWAIAKSGRGVMTVKSWVVEKAQQTAKHYNIFIDKQDAGNGFVQIVATKLAETDKAVKVHAESGFTVGNSHGWDMWIPKSQMK